MSINLNHSSGKIYTENADLTLDALGANFNVSASSNRIVNVQDPIESQDAVTKKYLDDRLSALQSGTLVNIQDILDKLSPQKPPKLDNTVISILDTGSYRITDFAQTDNTGLGLSAAPGDIVQNVIRSANYTSSNLDQVGPGNSGTLNVLRNNIVTSSVTLDENDNSGQYTDVDSIFISSNVDYGTITGNPLGFDYVYSAYATGTSSAGWNNLSLQHTLTDSSTVETSAVWYSDQSNPGAPVIENITVEPSTTQTGVVYSSSVPHYTYQQYFDISFDVSKLSGDFYPSSDQFITAGAASSTSAFGTTQSITYQTAGIATPIPQNYLATGSYTVNTVVPVKAGTGKALPTSGFALTIDNSYTTSAVTVSPGKNVLYMFDDLTFGQPIDETKILVQDVGYGTGDAYRVETVEGDTPAGDIVLPFNGFASELNSYDATVVAGIAAHDTTDYSVNYLPVGPNLSTGRDNAQYIEFAFERTAVSKFAIEYSGRVSGCWIRLPGASTDSTSTLNGWLDTTIPYEGIGIPGANTTAGGNGSNGCGLAGIIQSNVTVVNRKTNVTFGTESSSNATDNTILVRFKLESGDSITRLKFVSAT